MSEWIRLLDAVHLISQELGGDKTAKKAIVERLKGNSIRAKCWWHASGIDIGKPYIGSHTYQHKKGEKAPSPEAFNEWYRNQTLPVVSDTRVGDGFATDAFMMMDGELGGSFWKAVCKKDLARWDWSTGFCIGTGLPPIQILVLDEKNEKKILKLPARIFALGVELKRSNVEKIIPDSKSSPVQKIELTPDLSKRGRPRNNSWGHWVGELILLHEKNRLEYMSATSIVQKIDATLEEEGFPAQAPSSAHPIVVTVLEHLRKRKK
ncbi:MAG: hypothetical protein GW854_13735 [Erythrobacter sp.]|nr:hypothetical protein [Erythrobacter sp.]